MRIALVGTRGVPARYGGFETAVEEIGSRLAARGHDVVVYCRSAEGQADPGKSYLGMTRVVLPCVRSKALETLSHTALSVTHLCWRGCDAAVMFNAANSVFLPQLRARRIPVATHVDGLEWQRAKWGGAAKKYYRRAEQLAVRWSDALIADAPGIADYYRAEFAVATELIAYGAPVVAGRGADRIAALGLAPRAYHLVVARMEPENQVDVIVRGYRASSARLPLVVVGSAPHAGDYTRHVIATAASDDRVRLLGAVWDQELLTDLYANSYTYVHGHSVGGTNPSLLRAMGAGASVLAYDVVFARDILDDQAGYFRTERELAQLFAAAEADPIGTVSRGQAGQRIIAERYQWDQVAAGYEQLLLGLRAGRSIHGTASGKRHYD